jgi:preprotein translocase subunit SecA
MYRQRNEILDHEDMKDSMIQTIEKEANDIVMFHADLSRKEKWNYEEMAETLSNLHRDSSHRLAKDELAIHKDSTNLVEVAQDYLRKEYKEKEVSIGDPELMRRVERAISLRVIDTLWMRHIDEMSKLREKVSLRGYGQRDPVIEYQNEAFTMFAELSREIQQQTVHTLFRVRVQQAEQQAQLIPVIAANKLSTNAAAIENTLTTNQIQKIAGVLPQNPTHTTSTQPQKGNVTVVNADTPTPGLDPELQKLMGQEATPAQTSTGGAPIGSTGERHHEKIGRNDPCPCGSGKKYKKCCGA